MNVITRPGLKPAYKQGIIVESDTVEGAKLLALDRASHTGRFNFAKVNMWRVASIQVMSLGGTSGRKTTDGVGS